MGDIPGASGNIGAGDTVSDIGLRVGRDELSHTYHHLKNWVTFGFSFPEHNKHQIASSAT